MLRHSGDTLELDQRKMENGKEIGKWKLENGKWKMENGFV